VDLRSESARELAALDERMRAAFQAGLEGEKQRWPASKAPLDLEIKTMGLRPAAEPPDTLPIVRKAMAAAKQVGITIFATRAGSTDSNIPMSLGIPAITITGGGNAQGAHSIDEWYQDTPDSYKGPQWAALILKSLTEP
jgi:acetylornithine deacetylase/succinyl-diaminopimelate desuccinylase-like protein